MAGADSKLKPYGLIYRIEHTVTGRVYIGQTTGRLTARWAAHQKQPECIKLHRAIKKYGPEAFLVSAVCYAHSKQELNEKEILFINQFSSTDHARGFNLRAGGSFGKHSEESRAKMSEALKVAWERPGLRAQWSKSREGGRPAEMGPKISAALTGKKATPEAKASLSKARTTLWADDQKRAAFIAAQNTGKAAPVFKARAAEKAKKQWADPEARARVLAAQAAGKAAFWADPVKRAARIAKRAATIEMKRLTA